MIEPIAGWGWRVTDAGIALTPPCGPQAGLIHYVERVRPLRPIADVAKTASAPASFVMDELGDPERVITDEGEYAALVSCRGRFNGHPVERVVGCVFVDDFYSLIAGVAFQQEHAELITHTVRTLVQRDEHYFGVRRRRYVYRGPPGWHVLFDPPYQARWFAIDYPRSRGMLFVPPAMPLPVDVVSARLLHTARAPSGYSIDDWTAVTRPDGLSGRLYRVGGADVCVLIAALDDAPYTYPLLLTTKPELETERAQLLRDVLQSIERLPARREQRQAEAAPVGIWID